MVVRWRVGMMVFGLALLARAATADETPGMVETQPAPSRPPIAGAIVAPPAPRAPGSLSFDASSRMVCLEVVDQYGCMGGEQFGLGFKYGEVHIGALFSGGWQTEEGTTYALAAPFFGGELGTRFYRLVGRPRWTFEMAGRGSVDFVFGLQVGGDDRFFSFVNTYGPDLRWTFGKRFAFFFRPAVGWDVRTALASTISDPPGASVNLALDARIGFSVRF